MSRQTLFWVQLGWYDILSRYRSTVLGVCWIVLINGLTVLAIGIVYGSLFGRDLANYFPYLTVGYILWLWISTSVVEMSSAFTSYRFILFSHAVDPTSVIARIFARNLIVLLHNAPIVLFVLVLYQGVGWKALLFPLGLVLTSIMLIAASGVLAFFCARFHDLQMIITAVVGVLFLVTPIIWSADTLGQREYIASCNPLTHVLDVLRKPLLDEIPSLTNYAVTAVIAAVAAAAFILCYRAFRTRYIFWL